MVASSYSLGLEKRNRPSFNESRREMSSGRAHLATEVGSKNAIYFFHNESMYVVVKWHFLIYKKL